MSARRIIIDDDDDDFINDGDLEDEDWDEDIPASPPAPVSASKKPLTAPAAAPKKTFTSPAASAVASDAKASRSTQDGSAVEKDNSFREFRKLCADIANENSHTGKTALVAKYLEKGSTGS